MSKVFVDTGISLDGFIAGPNGGANNPLGDNGIKMHEWMFKQKSFREHLGMEGGDTNNSDNNILENVFTRIGPILWAKICSSRVKRIGLKKLPSIARYMY